ncbi:MAG TPA: NYN domain-containing protein [Anaerolineales bacterium]|nr:NYN domain-containing protein [Anaerolineales bacterium]HNM38547.1 NYN domain-containing protein [Anaerolineales bacterium]
MRLSVLRVINIMRISVYVDGFNFYHGLTENTKYRWCDLLKLTKQFLPNGEYGKIKLFAAHSKEYYDNLGKPERQNRYLQALKTIPGFEFIPSKFSQFKKTLPLRDSPKDKPEFVHVRGYKEKGADVNLASHLISDGIKNLYDIAVVFTNDSDLVEPIRVVRYDLNKKVYILLTCKNRNAWVSKELITVAKYHKLVEEDHLRVSQLPDVVTRPGKPALKKPLSW